ncbi:MAG TPA: AmmeMemoRadiSam system protein A [Armatimonadota bacterium]|jgi:hypothetical protein
MLTTDQQRFLLELAREAIATMLVDHRMIAPPIVDDALRESLGAFVTLKDRGELRGCIGYPEPTYPLYETIIRGGIAAALHDPRFPPVARKELDQLSVEISVLSLLTPAQPEAVTVGTHGLVVEHGHARGLLLPQVPVEWGWGREEFLDHTCRKAGLPHDAWLQGARLFTFTAQVFSEEEFLPSLDEPLAGDL